jgi:tellurite methyltransferase
MNELREKWNRIYLQEEAGKQKPASVLTEYAFLLPLEGDALDLASGSVRTRFFLRRMA